MAIAEDRRRLTTRLTVVRVSIGVAFGLLAGGFWFFQVVQHAQFKEMAENNHQRTLTLRAPRGIIYDRTGKLLVENRNSFNISIVREHTKDLDRTVRMVAAVAGIEEKAVREIVDRHRREPSYRPIVVVQDATLAQVAAVMARRLDFELPDVIVQEVPTRQYPDQDMAAHLIGYVGEASEDQMQADGVTTGSIVGQFGVERVYNKLLMGEDGAKRVVVNSMGREIRTLEEVPPVQGRRVQLTINYAMQKAAEDALRNYGYNGSAVVLEPKTGEVLTLTSLPAFDPNDFATGIDRATWASLNTDKLRPLQNRAIQGRYSPGSTFKIVVATAALEEGLITPERQVFCPGGGTFYGRFFQCLGKHGFMDLRHAIEKSCNTYFYTIGNMLGVDKMYKWSEKLGLALKSGIDLPNEGESIVPSTEWKLKRNGERWYPGETISVAIGQGQLSVTPISMAVMMATVANGGTRVVPRLVKAQDVGNGWQAVDVPPSPYVPFLLKPETTAAVRDGLWMVVNGAGTGRRAMIDGRDVAGKTGTAQVISLQGRDRARGKTDQDLRDHGWFVFFAPKDNPEIAGVVFAEHGEHGSSAAQVARHIIDTYFAQRDGQPLPVLVPPAPPAPAAPARITAATTAGGAPPPEAGQNNVASARRSLKAPVTAEPR
jgi:penicillin-binding protein 2